MGRHMRLGIKGFMPFCMIDKLGKLILVLHKKLLFEYRFAAGFVISKVIFIRLFIVN